MKKYRRHIKQFIGDATANYMFFVPLFIFLNTVTFFFGLPYWNIETITTYAVTGILGSFFLGGVYGRFLNMWRKKLNYQ